MASLGHGGLKQIQPAPGANINDGFGTIASGSAVFIKK